MTEYVLGVLLLSGYSGLATLLALGSAHGQLGLNTGGRIANTGDMRMPGSGRVIVRPGLERQR